MTDKETPHLSLDERAYREVRQMIVNGDLKPGTQIVQDALANRLGLSRTPLRKAIASLAQENFLEMDARGVAYVRSFSGEELTSIWEIRAVLEGLVCRLAARHAGPEHVAYLRSLIVSAAEKTTPQDWTAYRKADVHFHNYLAELSSDALLMKILDSYQILSLTLARGLLRPPEETLPEHLEIVDALFEKDADRAEHVMVRHIRSSIQYVSTFSVESEGQLLARLRELTGNRVASLAEASQETVLVASFDADGAVIAQYVEGRQPLRIALDPYANLPLHATAAGKVLLASKEDDEISTCLSSSGMKRFTSRTIASFADLHEHLKEVRDQGYALELGEHAEGVNSIAVPIISGERAIGALAVLGPATRLGTGRCDEVISALRAHAAAIFPGH